jgi:hypothetical protein
MPLFDLEWHGRRKKRGEKQEKGKGRMKRMMTTC